MKRIVIVGLMAAFALIVTACQTIEPTGASSYHTPVIFVHGWNADETTWNTAVSTFETAGYTSGDITVIYYPSTDSAAQASAILSTEVDKLIAYTGKAKVDIVSHSFGSMVSRYCIELGGCAGKVDRWMSLAGADNGTSTAQLCIPITPASCNDMAGTDSTITTLQANWSQVVNQGVRVEVQWSPNDGVIVPATNSEELSPATNVELSSTLTHLTIPNDPGVLAETIRFFNS